MKKILIILGVFCLILKLVSCGNLSKLKLILLFFCIMTIFQSFAQSDKINLINENNFKVRYSYGDSFLKFHIETKEIPSICVDINQNKKMDAYVDRLYSVINKSSLCVAVYMDEDGSTTPCGQATNATLSYNGYEYLFTIPKNELTYMPNRQIFVTFKLWDGNNSYSLPKDEFNSPYILSYNYQINNDNNSTSETYQQDNSSNYQINNESNSTSKTDQQDNSYSVSKNQEIYHKAIALDPDGIMAHYGYAPIYEAPTDASEIIGKVYDKEIFWVIPSNENWLAVKLSNDVNGYIFYQRVKLIDDNKPSSDKNENISAEEMSLILNLLGSSANSSELICKRKSCKKEFCCGWEHSSTGGCREACMTGVKCRGDYCSQYCCEKD